MSQLENLKPGTIIFAPTHNPFTVEIINEDPLTPDQNWTSFIDPLTAGAVRIGFHDPVKVQTNLIGNQTIRLAVRKALDNAGIPRVRLRPTFKGLGLGVTPEFDVLAGPTGFQVVDFLLPGSLFGPPQSDLVEDWSYGVQSLDPLSGPDNAVDLGAIEWMGQFVDAAPIWTDAPKGATVWKPQSRPNTVWTPLSGTNTIWK